MASACRAACDNRPLRFNEWDAMRPQSTFVSATPGPWEMNETGGVFSEQVIRPRRLIDPPVHDSSRSRTRSTISSTKPRKPRARAIARLSPRSPADGRGPDGYLHESGLKVRYMHSDVETLERIELIRELRLGVYDVAGRHQLLREGPNIPDAVGRDPRRRQGRLPPVGNLADPDHRPRARNVEGA